MPTMKQHLFVYGTLGPGRPNEHVMTAIGGTWSEGSVYGYLREKGWGSRMGFPGIELDPAGHRINGFVFSSEHLDDHWQALDEFEGEEYERVTTVVDLGDGTTVSASIYRLRSV